MGISNEQFLSFFPYQPTEEDSTQNPRFLPPSTLFPEASTLSSATYPIYEEMSSLIKYMNILSMEVNEIKQQQEERKLELDQQLAHEEEKSASKH